MRYLAKIKAKNYNEIRAEVERRIDKKFGKVRWYIPEIEELNGKETGWFKVTVLVMDK